MNRKQKMALYESIMAKVAVEVKNAINEAETQYIIWYQDIPASGNGYRPGEREYAANGFKFDNNVYDTVEEAEAVMSDYIDDLIATDLRDGAIESDSYDLSAMDPDQAMQLVKSGDTYALYAYDEEAHTITYSACDGDDGEGTVTVSVRRA